MSEVSIPAVGEPEVRRLVDDHRDWRVYATDYKREHNGIRVIFYLESKFQRKFQDISGEKRHDKPMYIESFLASRVAKEPELVARQLVNTANTKLSQNMRSLEGK